MSKPGTRIRVLHTAAIVVALVSGSYALIALVVGSPVEFGITLALCGAGWVGADFVERRAERADSGLRRTPMHGPRVRVPDAAKMPPHTVHVGPGESRSRRRLATACTLESVSRTAA